MDLALAPISQLVALLQEGTHLPFYVIHPQLARWEEGVGGCTTKLSEISRVWVWTTLSTTLDL